MTARTDCIGGGAGVRERGCLDFMDRGFCCPELTRVYFFSWSHICSSTIRYGLSAVLWGLCTYNIRVLESRVLSILCASLPLLSLSFPVVSLRLTLTLFRSRARPLEPRPLERFPCWCRYHRLSTLPFFFVPIRIVFSRPLLYTHTHTSPLLSQCVLTGLAPASCHVSGEKSRARGPPCQRGRREGRGRRA